MRALEFKSIIKNNRISIPAKIQSKFKFKKDVPVRVIVLLDDSEGEDDLIFQEATQNQFLEGYSDSDSVYDKL